jgi:hypothetical protein
MKIKTFQPGKHEVVAYRKQDKYLALAWNDGYYARYVA